MPSGSRGGGGGSHFGGGGGGSRGGSHFSGGSSARNYRPRGIRHGRSVVFLGGKNSGKYMYSWADSLCSILIVILFFVGSSFAIAFMAIPSIDADIRIIENDYEYYQTMIDYAELHPEYIIEGTVINPYYNEDADKWYVAYYFYTSYGVENRGYTFSIYTAEEAASFHAGDTILLAVNELPLTGYTDSINMDYKDMPIEQDGEYVTCLNGKNNAIIFGTISGIVTFGIIVALIVIRKKTIKIDDQPTKTQATTKSTKRYCPYCGSTISAKAEKCKNCGAGQDYEV